MLNADRPAKHADRLRLIFRWLVRAGGLATRATSFDAGLQNVVVSRIVLRLDLDVDGIRGASTV